MRFKGKVSFVPKGGDIYARASFVLNGKRKQVWRKVVDTRAEAKDAVIDEIERQLNPPPETDKTFLDLAKYYKEFHAVPARFERDVKIQGKKSWRQMRSCIDKMETYFGDIKLKLITRDKVMGYRTFLFDDRPTHTIDGKRVKTDRSFSSVHQHLKILRAMLNVALSNDWITKVPSFKEMISPASEVSRDIIPTEIEFEQILLASENRPPHVKAVILMITDIGARPVEIWNLTWKDINGREITLTSDKGKRRTKRTLVATTRLMQALEKLDRTRDSVMGVRSIQKPWETLQKETGLFHLTPYHLRHLFASRIDRLPISQLAKQKLMGHTSSIIFSRYAKIGDDVAENVAQMLNENPYLPIQENDTLQ